MDAEEINDQDVATYIIHIIIMLPEVKIKK